MHIFQKAITREEIERVREIAKNRELFQIKLKAMLSQAKEDCCNPNYRNRGG